MAGAQRFQGGVNEHPDVADRELGDFADLSAAEVVLKFELQHFLLPRREGRHDAEQKPARLLALDPFVRRGVVAFILFEQFLVEIRHALFLSANVEGAIAADGKKPFGWSVIELLALAALQLDESLLHHIAGPIADRRGCASRIAGGAARSGATAPLGHQLGLVRPRA
jgi:hypothetical protein